MGAAAILAGRAFSFKMAVVTILAAMIVSDFALSRMYGYPVFGFVSLFVYGSFVLHAWLGRLLCRITGGGLIAAIAGALLFFLVTNFGVWLEGGLYPRTSEGLVQCYTMAIPFFKSTLLGNLFWTPVLSLFYRLYKTRLHRFRVPRPAV
jgi:hypothetical protein